MISQRRILILTLGAACTFGTTGCNVLAKLRGGRGEDAGATPPKVLTAPPTPDVRDGDLRFRETKARVLSSLQGTSCEVSFADFPPSANVTAGATALTTNVEGFARTKLDCGDRLARVSVKDAFVHAFKFDPEIKLGLDFGPQAKLSTNAAPFGVSIKLTELFTKAPKEPFTLGAAPKVGQHSVVYMDYVTPQVFGPAQTVGEIDWVALLQKQRRRSGRRCTGYRKAGETEANRAFTLELFDEKVSVYEVRTGKPVVEKVFLAPDVCPTASIGGLKSEASHDEQIAWLRQQVATRR